MAHIETSSVGFQIKRPKYGSLPVAAALSHDWRGYHVTEKLDGCWHELTIGRSIIVGERMADETFFAFDLAVHQGVDVRDRPRTERLARLDTFPLRRPATPALGESPAAFLQRVLARGGEGIVAAAWDGGFGYDICKVKRFETFDCVVLAKYPGGMTLSLNGEPAGNCALLGQSFGRVRVGDVVEIGAFCRLRSGKFREPRFIRPRPGLTERRHRKQRLRFTW